MRYRLRTLLIVVTAICCLLAYEMSWIRERRAFFHADKNIHASFGSTPAPGLLRLFNARGYTRFCFPVPMEATAVNDAGERTISAAYPLLKRCKELFPEAKMQVVTGGPGTNFAPLNADYPEDAIRPIPVMVVR